MPVNTVDLLPGGGGGNNPGGLAQRTAFGYISSSTSGTALQPIICPGSDISLGFYSSGASTVALSYGTFNLAGLGLLTLGSGASGTRLSVTTWASGTGMVQGDLRVIFNASGFSLGYSSGVSMYFFGGSTLSAAQA